MWDGMTEYNYVDPEITLYCWNGTVVQMKICCRYWNPQAADLKSFMLLIRINESACLKFNLKQRVKFYFPGILNNVAILIDVGKQLVTVESSFIKFIHLIKGVILNCVFVGTDQGLLIFDMKSPKSPPTQMPMEGDCLWIKVTSLKLFATLVQSPNKTIVRAFEWNGKALCPLDSLKLDGVDSFG
jgi:hypothetical protein